METITKVLIGVDIGITLGIITEIVILIRLINKE